MDIKRFVNQDVVVGGIDRISSLNRYSYVEGNPVSYLDPFGLEKTESWTTNIHKVLDVISTILLVALAITVSAMILFPVIAPIAIVILEYIGIIGAFVALANVILYSVDMANAGDYNEEFFEALRGAGYSALSIGLFKINFEGELKVISDIADIIVQNIINFIEDIERLV